MTALAPPKAADPTHLAWPITSPLTAVFRLRTAPRFATRLEAASARIYRADEGCPWRPVRDPTLLVGEPLRGALQQYDATWPSAFAPVFERSARENLRRKDHSVCQLIDRVRELTAGLCENSERMRRSRIRPEIPD